MHLLQATNPHVALEVSDIDSQNGCLAFSATFVHQARTISTQNGWKTTIFDPAATKGVSGADRDWPLEHAADLPGELDAMTSFIKGKLNNFTQNAVLAMQAACTVPTTGAASVDETELTCLLPTTEFVPESWIHTYILRAFVFWCLCVCRHAIYPITMFTLRVL